MRIRAGFWLVGGLVAPTELEISKHFEQICSSIQSPCVDHNQMQHTVSNPKYHLSAVLCGHLSTSSSVSK